MNNGGATILDIWNQGKNAAGGWRIWKYHQVYQELMFDRIEYGVY